MRRMTVTLHQDEHEALITLAEQERRDPRDQAAILIRSELKRRGRLPVDEQQGEAQAEEANDGS